MTEVSTIKKNPVYIIITIGLLWVCSAPVKANRNVQITIPVSIFDIQFTTDPSGDSPYTGQTIRISGVVTATFPDGFILADGNGPWQAVYVFTHQFGPDTGDELVLSGTVTEYYGMTEIENPYDLVTLSTGNTLAPLDLCSGNVASEQYESVSVLLSGITVTSLDDYGEWSVDDGSGTIVCDDLNDYVYFPHIGDLLESLTGIVIYQYEKFVIQPRNTPDITGNMLPHYALLGDIVTMNDDLDVLHGWYLEVKGDRIAALSKAAPDQIPIIETTGFIFPGLIDSANHPLYDAFDRIPYPVKFRDRNEVAQHPMSNDYSMQYQSFRSLGIDPQIWKLVEVRALCAGTTCFQGINCNGHFNDYFAHQGIGIANAERFPSRAYTSYIPLWSEDDWTEYKTSEFWNRFVINLSEGYTDVMLQEFYTWVSWGMLDDRTSIIHGIPYSDPEWELMVSSGAHLIWTPSSDLYLYDTTSDVPEALLHGVPVAVGTDWTSSGNPNLLMELKFAEHINQTLWSGIITPEQLAGFVTRNAAGALGISDLCGQIQTGMRADLLIIDENAWDPYQSLLEVSPKQVLLTVVSGRPMFGDTSLMSQFPFAVPQEDIIICGVPRKLAVCIDTHSIEFSDMSFSQVLSDLESAWDKSSPKLCDLLSYDPCAIDTPTPAPSATPTPSSSSPTPNCGNLGIQIWMPAHMFHPGDPCSCTAIVCNPSESEINGYPLFVILDIHNNLYFAPSFESYDHYLDSHPMFPSGKTVIAVVSEFAWPAGTGSAYGLMWYGALTNPEITELMGDPAVWEFGWESTTDSSS